MKYKKYLVLMAIVFIGVPTVSFGGSFTHSLIQGKTPSEALNIIANQIDYITGRVDDLENQQQRHDSEIKNLKEENAILQGKIENNTQLESEKLLEEASCNRFREEIENMNSISNIELNALEERIWTLKQTQRGLREGIRSNRPQFNDTNDEVKWVKSTLEAGEEYNEDIERLERELDILKEAYRVKVSPLIEEATKLNCLLG